MLIQKTVGRVISNFVHVPKVKFLNISRLEIFLSKERQTVERKRARRAPVYSNKKVNIGLEVERERREEEIFA